MLQNEHMPRCPHCDRPFGGFRFGVRWGALAICIIDAVRRAGPDGISSDALFELAYANRDSKRTALKGYMRFINERLSEIGDVRIHTRNKKGRYHLTRIKKTRVR